VTNSDLKNLKAIVPKRFNLPLDESSKHLFFYVVGGKVNKGNKVGQGVGVYKFTNITNGFIYGGSLIQLANRLAHAYLGKRVGKRKIELALQ
jgi:hypothetical protein